MNKFREVFEPLNIKQDIYDVFADTDVERIVMNKGQKLMRIYLVMERLIQKHYLYDMENQLARNLFQDKETKVKICETYRLPEQYTISYILEHYYESMLLELSQENKILHTLVKHSDPAVTEENVLTLQFPDTMVAKNMEQELRDYLELVFDKRFHRPVQIHIDFVKQKESRYRKEQELRAERILQ